MTATEGENLKFKMPTLSPSCELTYLFIYFWNEGKTLWIYFLLTKEIVASLWDWLLLETKRFTTNNWQVCQYVLQFAPRLFGKHVAIGPVLYKYINICIYIPIKKQKHRQEGRRVGKDLLSFQKIQFCLRTFG